MAAPIARLRWWLAGGLILVAALVAPFLCAPGGDALREGFTNPPPEARLRCYWWWLNGNTTKAAITRDLEQMKAKDYGGALLVDADGSSQQGNNPAPAGPMFGSPEWRVLYLHALREAQRLDLEISLNILSGWNLGGPEVTPAEGAKLLTWSRVTVEGPADLKRELPQPESVHGFYQDFAVLAYPLRHGAALPGGRHAHPATGHQDGLPGIRHVDAADCAAAGGFPRHRGRRRCRGRRGAGRDGPHGRGRPIHLACPGGKLGDPTHGIRGLGRAGLDIQPDVAGLGHRLHGPRRARSLLEAERARPLLDLARPYLGKTLRYVVTDSWELGGINWTGKFRQEFRQRRGYDLLPYLPVVAGRIVGGRDIDNRFLNDFRRTIGDLIVSRHYAVFAELAARYGLGIHPESGGPHGAPIDALETLGVSALPQTEFWAPSATHRIRDGERFFVKEASSAAHIYGKPLVAAEGMTSIGPQWEESPASLKPAFDQAVCEGMNRLVWHTFTSSPREMGLPGQEYFAGTHLNPNVTWWPQAGAFIGYMNRAQFLMQQGQPVSDALYYYGDHVPNFVQLKTADPAGVLPGYDYDVTDEHVLTDRLSAKDGQIALPEGVTYRLLVLPAVPSVSVAALRAVRKLVAEGAAVLGRDRSSHRVGRWQGDARCAPSLARSGATARQKASSSGISAKAPCFAAGTAREALAALGVLPDFEFTRPRPLDYVHRQTGGSGILLHPQHRPRAVSETGAAEQRHGSGVLASGIGRTEPEPSTNSPPTGGPACRCGWSQSVPCSCCFAGRRATGLSDCRRMAGSCSRHRPLELTATCRRFELRLSRTEPSASRHRRLATSRRAPPRGASSPPIFPRGDVRAHRGALDHSIHAWLGRARRPTTFWTGWRSWTESADPGIRYYSGTAKYSRQIVIPGSMLRPGQQLYLDLGEVREIAQVRLNGQSLGLLWKKPFQVALTASAKPGSNQLEIEITNFWPNRLIGDQQLPPEKRFTRTNITKFRADSPLLPSGLLGPVSMRVARRVKLAPARAGTP